MMEKTVEPTYATQLLVSVRNAAEAQLAVSAGVSMVDVKEPLRGPLGAAEFDVCQEVISVAGGQATVSAALGELLNYETQEMPSQLALAKFGLSGCSARPDWPHLWRQAIATFPTGVSPVAVIYADHELAQAPCPAEVLGVGRELGCKYVLVDTFDKSLGSLLEQWSWVEIQRLVEQVKSQGLQIVLAGSLGMSDIRRILPLKPGVVAVRGAACGGDRNGALDADRVNELVSLVNGITTTQPSQATYVAY